MLPPHNVFYFKSFIMKVTGYALTMVVDGIRYSTVTMLLLKVVSSISWRPQNLAMAVL